MKFDGHALAKEIEIEVADKVQKLVKQPRIVSILVGSDPASVLYTKLKKEAAQRVGIDFVVERVFDMEAHSLKEKIAEIGTRDDVTGVMVQLPIVGLQGLTLKGVLEAIPLSKDVDGLRWEESGIKPATVTAILSILEKIAKDRGFNHAMTQGAQVWRGKFVVLGAGGAVGRPLTQYLRQMGVVVDEIEYDTPKQHAQSWLSQGEVVVSCVGKMGLVQAEMVRDGLIAIDVGMSEVGGKVVGDMTQEVYQKASISVEVPGGVGPVTVVSLMANAVDIGLSKHRF